MAGAANVVMQLARPGVGYGVVESSVDSGNLFLHPFKRARTTFTYLAVATSGTAQDKRVYRRAVDRAHARVRSTERSPVRYNAFDPELQLWVAACLYKGFEDAFEALSGSRLSDAQREAAYAGAAPLGTTLQVRPESWPASRAEFGRYWQSQLEHVRVDEPVREHLMAVVELRFLPAVLRVPLARPNRFVTTGFLPPVFREQMRLPWTERDQRRFDRFTRAVGAVALRLPGPLRRFPFNAFLRDFRWRVRTGRRLV
ncbi:oxygenase MpaB family protein [Saccharopolyspora griseoalba]|uniref:Oxygenase MpaB family protein n=1 Tax=Saccharopolyspora griseoalba TaxID=1431848 RepID=A0ABW2LQG6_9PSEU